MRSADRIEQCLNWRASGKHLLAQSTSHFDPKPTSINLNLSKDGLRVVSGGLLPALCRSTVNAIARTAGDFGTDPRWWCVRRRQAVSSIANLRRRQRPSANCSLTIYRKSFSRRKAVGVTPIHFLNTRFSWVGPLNPTASATSAMDRSHSDNIFFATLIRSDRTY
jgi:hypothetical protein